MQHEPYIVGFIEADFDEMVPGPQRAELVCRVRVAVQSRRTLRIQSSSLNLRPRVRMSLRDPVTIARPKKSRASRCTKMNR